jgi:hypothetical protein
MEEKNWHCNFNLQFGIGWKWNLRIRTGAITLSISTLKKQFWTSCFNWVLWKISEAQQWRHNSKTLAHDLGQHYWHCNFNVQFGIEWKWNLSIHIGTTALSIVTLSISTLKNHLLTSCYFWVLWKIGEAQQRHHSGKTLANDLGQHYWHHNAKTLAPWSWPTLLALLVRK